MPSLYYSTEGIVIKKMPFREADFLVRLLTRDFGKIDVVARGARKSIAKLNPHLDILNLIRLSFVENGERIPTLTDAEIIERYDEWFLSAERLALCARALKTIDILIPFEQKDARLFTLVCDFFQAFRHGGCGEDELEKMGLEFLQKLFAHEGYSETDSASSPKRNQLEYLCKGLPHDVSESIIKTWRVSKS